MWPVVVVGLKSLFKICNLKIMLELGSLWDTFVPLNYHKSSSPSLKVTIWGQLTYKNNYNLHKKFKHDTSKKTFTNMKCFVGINVHDKCRILIRFIFSFSLEFVYTQPACILYEILIKLSMTMSK